MPKTKGELEDMTKDELVEYADDNDIEVHHHWVKDEIIKEIMKAEKKAAKAEGKQEDELEPEVQPAEAQTTAEASPAAGPAVVDPKLAANQELAQKLPDANTRFAADPVKEK